MDQEARQGKGHCELLIQQVSGNVSAHRDGVVGLVYPDALAACSASM